MKITKSQTKLTAIRSDRLNLHLRAHPISFTHASLPIHSRRSHTPRWGRTELPRSSCSPSSARSLKAGRNDNTAYGTLLPADMPIRKKIRQTNRNRKNKNLAIPAAAAAIPVNPKSAATSAIIRKINAQRSMLSPPRSKSHW
jgi:hypothetical protein